MKSDAQRKADKERGRLAVEAGAGPIRQLSALAPDCAWCGLRKSAGLHQGTECCNECREGGRVFRVRMSMGRWKRGRDAKEST